MQKFIFSFALVFSSFLISAQTIYQAQDIIASIDAGKALKISGAIIQGDLDFTTIKKKYKGGRYGVPGGIAQEYFTRVDVPLSFTNCQFQGSLITKSEIKVRQEKKENFTTIRAALTFDNCVFTEPVEFVSIGIKEVLTFRDCTFQKTLRFEHASFDKSPELEGNIYQSKFINKNTNWDFDQKTEAQAPKASENETVQITLHNPTASSIKIKFDQNKWNLSPFGKSGINRPVGTKIYILDGSQKRLALTLNQSMNSQTFDISKF